MLTRCNGCRGIMLDPPVLADDYRLCRGCTQTWLPCVSCSRLTDPGMRTATSDPVCGNCAASFFDCCVRCRRYSAATRYVSGGSRVCPGCESHYNPCPACATLVRPGAACDPCGNPGRVWSYSYKPDPRFHGEGPLHLGMELEVIVPDWRYSQAVTETTDALGGLGYLKQDSSIQPCGFEIVTHPMSWQHALDHFPWELLDQLAELGCRTDDSVGLHVHASRAGFDNPAHIYRWLKLLYRNESEVTTLARRSSHYAMFDGTGRAGAGATAKGKHRALRLGRYQAINPNPRTTLEVRVFASSLSAQSVQAALAFTAASVEYTRAIRVADVREGAWEWNRFAAWVARHPDYQPLTAEMRELACAC